MAENSVVGQVGDFFSSFFKAPPQIASPQSPGTAPTQGQATAAAQSSELQQEQAGYAANTDLTGGQGLTTNPATASQTLLGS